MSWRVAKSLDVLLGEINEAAPNRSKVSDGSIGDAAHASRDSDHNPWIMYNGDGIVRARDFTHDPAGGLDCDDLALMLLDLAVNKRHPALARGAYIIWEGYIASATEDGDPWDWEVYRGSNDHRKHLHLSVALAPAGFDSTAPWGVMEEDMSPEQEDRIVERSAKRTLELLMAYKPGNDDDTVKQILNRLSTQQERQ